jgi:hypothetical protein
MSVSDRLKHSCAAVREIVGDCSLVKTASHWNESTALKVVNEERQP